jgi:hypothetical protein
MFYSAAPPIEACRLWRMGSRGSSGRPYRSLWNTRNGPKAYDQLRGNYMYVNKNLVEMLALFALCAQYGMSCGLDVYVRSWFSKGKSGSLQTQS